MRDQVDKAVLAHQVYDIDEVHEQDPVHPVHPVKHKDEHTQNKKSTHKKIKKHET